MTSRLDLSVEERDFYRESYIRRLHDFGVPATKGLQIIFNKNFCDGHGLHGKKRIMVQKLIARMTSGFKNNGEPFVVKRSPQLKKIYAEVMAKFKQKRFASVRVKHENNRSQHQFGIEERYDQNLEDVVENNRAIAFLENINEESTTTLKMEDEECQELEEANYPLVEVLEQNSQEQVQLSIESDMAKLVERNRFLEEALYKKEQMLEMVLQTNHTLSAITNKLIQRPDVLPS